MALNKVAQTQLGKFGSLTSTAHAKSDNSIFGKNICNTVCSFTDSFKDISVGDNGSYDIFSEQGMKNINKEIEIITGQDKAKKAPKTIEMNEKAFAMIQDALKSDTYKSVSLNS